MTDIETVTALGYDPENPWQPVRCADCKTILRHPGDAACESCEVIAETMHCARQMDGARRCHGCGGAGLLAAAGAQAVCALCGGLGEVPDQSLSQQRAQVLADLDGRNKCRVCGCTDEDCYACIQRTGVPCGWVEPDLCSACDVQVVLA